MIVKLTLSLDAKIIAKAKAFAQKNNISLSKLVEQELSELIPEENAEEKISPFIKSLSIKGLEAKTDKELKEEYLDYLENKYQ